MATLDGLLDEVRSSSAGRLVLLGGEAGVGKTTLLLAFCRRRGRSARILWGACEPLRTPRPLGPFLDIAEATGGPLVGLVEGVARPYEVAAGLSRELGAHRPTVLVLEDIHWADDERGTGDALRTLSRRLFFVGRVEEGEVLAREAVALLERLPSGHELAMAYGNLSQRRMVVEDVEDAITWGQRALAVARSIDDTEALVYTLTNIGAAEFDAGSDHGAIKLKRALALALRHGLEDYAGRAFSASSGARSVSAGSISPRPTWSPAWSTAMSAVPHSAPSPRGSSMTVLGLIRARRGEADAAAPLAEERARADPTGELDRIGANAAARAEAAWLAGENATVVAETEAADVWRTIGCPYEAALALADGEDEFALRHAVEMFQKL